MSETPPLDLRSLAEVESPEVLRDALRQFRRRMLRRDLWVALLVLLAIGAFLYGKTPKSLPDRMAHASEATFTYAVWQLPGGTVQLRSVSNLGETTGLTFDVIGNPSGGGADGLRARPAEVVPRDVIASEGALMPTEYFEIPRSASGAITMDFRVPSRPSLNTTFTIDLRALNVPASEWRINP